MVKVLIAALLGTERSTISRATSLTGKILAAGIPLPPAAPPPGIPLRTLADLHGYAARHGITLTGPPDTAPETTLTTPPRRKRSLFLNVA